jgi:hypothetical protein
MARWASLIAGAVIATCAGLVYAQGRELGQLDVRQQGLEDTVAEYVRENREWQRLLMQLMIQRDGMAPGPTPTPAG